MIGEMLKVICDPLELWKYATDETNIRSCNSQPETSTILVRC